MKNIKEIIALICCCNLIFSVPMTMAAPQGGKVVSGSAQIHHSGATTTINQNSNRAVINWNSFDIGKNETVRHNMPSANSAGLHRVVGGGGASQILGQLQSNGNVYLVNPAGVVIHKGARIDTNSFTATSRDISNDNFMKGNMVFDKPGRPDAKIINQGTISVKENGLAALVAPTVRNDGVIAGKLAKVALASGDSTWKLDMHGDDLITFTVDEKDVDTLHAVDGTPLAGVENSGSIKAEGGVVVLTAAQLDGIVGSVVNSGEVSAASAELKGGKIVFKGTGSGVDIVNTGTVDASSVVADGGSVRMDTDGTTRTSGVIAATGGQQGGKVVVTGKDVALTGKAKLDVSGNKGGGTALVGGNALGKGPERNARTTKVEKEATIVADARTKGDGGQVVVWSDEKTYFDGTITARGGREGGNGGHVETSGNYLKIGEKAWVNTAAYDSSFGTWLLDPIDFTIAESDGNISGGDLSTLLESNNVVFSSEEGDIYVNDDITWSSPTMLVLNAYKDINVNRPITATNDEAGLSLKPETGTINLRAKITLSGSNPRLIIGNKQYKVINTLEELQNINKSIIGDYLKGYFALGSDLDALETKDWNDGKGFSPIGGYFNRVSTDKGVHFAGTFNGLGHTISNLTINRPNEDHVGLFGITDSGAYISNIGLNNISVVGNSEVGSIVGCAQFVSIENCYSTGSVTGNEKTGGFAGRLYGPYFGDKKFIRNCFTSCNVYANKSNTELFGGFMGYAWGDKLVITDCYSTGHVDETNRSGGFSAYTSSYMTLTNCYYDKQTSGQNSSSGATGLTTEQMMQSSNYDGLDFVNTWTIEEGKTYPSLKLFAMATTPGGDTTDPTTPGGGTTDPTTPGGGTTDPTTPGGGTTDPTTPGGGTTDPTTPGGGTTDPTTPGGGTTDPTTPGGGTTDPTTPGGGTTDPTTPGGGTTDPTTPGGGTTDPRPDTNGNGSDNSIATVYPHHFPNRELNINDRYNTIYANNNDKIYIDGDMGIVIERDKNYIYELAKLLVPEYVEIALPANYNVIKILQEYNNNRTKILFNALGSKLITLGVGLGIDLTLGFLTKNPMKAVDILFTALEEVTDPNLYRSIAGLILYIKSGIAFERFENNYHAILDSNNFAISEIAELVELEIQSKAYSIAASLITDPVYDDWKVQQQIGVDGEIFIDNINSIITGGYLFGDNYESILKAGYVFPLDKNAKLVSQVNDITGNVLSGAKITENIIGLLNIDKDKISDHIFESTRQNIYVLNILNEFPNMQLER